MATAFIENEVMYKIAKIMWTLFRSKRSLHFNLSEISREVVNIKLGRMQIKVGEYFQQSYSCSRTIHQNGEPNFFSRTPRITDKQQLDQRKVG